MINRRHWHTMPMRTVRDALPAFTWQKVGDMSPAASTAALMLWVGLRFMAVRVYGDEGSSDYVASPSYDEIGTATGLSRSLISQGLKRLQGQGLIVSEGSNQQRRYRLKWEGDSWFKLPCQAIVADNVIRPFRAFTMRSKFELYAMKLYLYVASVRDGSKAYSLAAYETISRHTGIPERDIPRAISILTGCELLSRVLRDHDMSDGSYGPNKYFLNGYTGLFIGMQQPAAPSDATQAAPRAPVSDADIPF